MAVRKFKPVTPGQRHKVAISFDTITTSKPEKSLLVPNHRSGGRSKDIATLCLCPGVTGLNFLTAILFYYILL
jgi:ribosomal protein L2